VCFAISQSRVLSPATRRPQSVIPFCVYKKLIIIAVFGRTNRGDSDLQQVRAGMKIVERRLSRVRSVASSSHFA